MVVYRHIIYQGQLLSLTWCNAECWPAVLPPYNCSGTGLDNHVSVSAEQDQCVGHPGLHTLGWAGWCWCWWQQIKLPVRVGKISWLGLGLCDSFEMMIAMLISKCGGISRCKGGRVTSWFSRHLCPSYQNTISSPLLSSLFTVVFLLQIKLFCLSFHGWDWLNKGCEDEGVGLTR